MRATDAASWEKRYVDDELPWDNGAPDVHLGRVIAAHQIAPGKALEVGCGTGTNSVWLAEQGFEITGMDISKTAIERAAARAESAGASCRFTVGNFLSEEVQDGPFKFVYDRGCLHSFDDAGDRARFASRIASLLEPSGIWHSLIGSTDGPPRDTGPPRRSAVDIVSALEPRFEILELHATTFYPDGPNPAAAWILVAMRRRIFGTT
jgi:SAM-dependent methyltransferase